MLPLLASIHANRRLLRDFVVRGLKARYVGSSMGFFWSVIFPVINLFVYMFVFRLVLKSRWSDYQGPLEVALVMLAGIVVWAAFAETVARSTNTLVENSNLIQKIVFPSELLPAYLAISSLINMCIGLPVVVLCVAWFSLASPPQVEFADASQLIGEQGGRSVVRVALTRGSSRDVRVAIECGGSASSGTDYALGTREVLIPRGCLSTWVPLAALADESVEGEETMVLSLGDPRGASLGPSRTQQVVISEARPLAGGIAEGWTDEQYQSRLGPRQAPDYQPLALGPALFCLPLLFALQILFTTGIGYALATLNLFLRDTYHLVGVFLTVWMFGTPIFYPAIMVRNAGFGWILDLNPMHWLVESYRAVLLYGAWPAAVDLLRFALAAVLVFWLGGRFFESQKRRFPDLL